MHLVPHYEKDNLSSGLLNVNDALMRFQFWLGKTKSRFTQQNGASLNYFPTKL